VADRGKTDKVNSAIHTENLIKRFPRTSGYRDLLPFRKKQLVTAVEDVCLDIKEGEFFGLLGPNGAGKTTLIKLLCSLVLPTSGTAQVFGFDILKQEQAVKKLVGLVSAEERSFYWRLTGQENLQFFAALYHLGPHQSQQRIAQLLKLVGLDQEADVRFLNYSTGMRQKLAIARGLLSEPKVLFVDEPTRSLDPISAQSVRAFLKEKSLTGKITVILATHNLNEAEQLCDRLAIMSHGKVIASGNVKELRNLFQTHEECRLQLRHFSEAAITGLKAVEGVFDCHLTKDDEETITLEIKMTNRSRVLPRILQIIIENGVEVVNCHLEGLPLEEIFTYALKNSEERQH
jgi:ABC-2 type transport system ATP-binding protein